MEKNMEHRFVRIKYLLFAGILFACPLEAYDSHHPDPMAILNGRINHSRSAAKKTKEDNATGKIQPWRMYKRHKEEQYVIKPEPYSIDSNKSDPELLGPQRTIESVETVVASAAVTEPVPVALDVPKPTSEGMTREACIGMIGQEKFDAYVQKYGGENGALHRCLILKRLH